MSTGAADEMGEGVAEVVGGASVSESTLSSVVGAQKHGLYTLATT